MRALLVRFSSLGDVVLATAAVEALREERPDLRVDVLTKPGFRDLFRNNPGVDRLVEWDPGSGLTALAGTLRRENYDWIIDLHANLRSRLLRLLLPRARWSVYRKGAVRRRLAVWLRRPSLLAGEPSVVGRYLGALAPLGVSGAPRLPKLYLGKSSRETIRKRLAAAGWSDARPLVGLAPGARWATKAWPRRHWVSLARELGKRGRIGLVMVGGSGESGLCRDILREAGVTGVNLAGEVSIRETAAVLERCEVLVTNDSAPMHLATAVGTRVVALFGPTVVGFGFRPLGPGDAVLSDEMVCRPCGLHGGERCPEGHHGCLENLGPGRVLAALEKISVGAG